MKRKLVSIAIALVLCASVSTLSFATNKMSGECGDKVIWSFDSSSGVLTISGSGAMYDYNASEQFQDDPRPWFAYRSKITSVIIQDGVSRIGNQAFAGGSPDISFINLKKLIMADSVISIGIDAFSKSGLEDVVLSQNLKSIENRAFTGCTDLKKIDLPDSLSSLGKDCLMNTGLSEVEIPKSVTAIGDFALGFKGGVVEPLPDFLIYGYAGSAAERYAKSYTYEALFNKWVFDTYSPEYFYNLHPEYENKSGQIFHFIAVSENASGFKDVHEDDWFATPVQWAIANNVTNGTGSNAFSPNMTCTTAQILTFLWRTAGSPESGGSNPFSDLSSNDYYYKPALWAAKNRLVTGNRLSGSAPCTRAATVTYLWKLSGSPTANGSVFSDVPMSATYAKAVSWAVAQGITTGTGDKQFSPDATCTRGQIVTFLYRWKNATAKVSHNYTDEELCDLVKSYYKTKFGQTPPNAKVDNIRNDTVTIQLFDTVGNHVNTWDWFTIDRTTGKGSSMFSGEIDLLDP